MHPRSIAAIHQLAHDLRAEALIHPDEVVIQCDARLVHARAMLDEDGRWVAAHWSESHAQWQSSDHPDAGPGYAYTYAGSLAGLRELGIRSYRTAVECLRRQIEVAHA